MRWPRCDGNRAGWTGQPSPPLEGPMTDSMRAFVIKKVGETGLVEKPVPGPGPEEAVVRTTAALICTSDVHTVKGALPVPDGRTLGHESVGVIEKLGS